MEDYFIFFLNGRGPKVFRKMENDLQYFLNRKTTSMKRKWKITLILMKLKISKQFWQMEDSLNMYEN